MSFSNQVGFVGSELFGHLQYDNILSSQSNANLGSWRMHGSQLLSFSTETYFQCLPVANIADGSLITFKNKFLFLWNFCTHCGAQTQP